MNEEIINEEENIGEPFTIDAIVSIEGEKFHSLEYFFDLHPNAQIQKINGRDYIGKCIGCDAILLDGDETFDWTDEIGCAECEKKRLKTSGLPLESEHATGWRYIT